MKQVYKVGLVFVLIITAFLAFPKIVLADSGKPGDGNALLIGGTYLLKSGEVRNDDLIIIGGAATLEEDSTVNGDILLLDASLDVFGSINGTITSVGSTVNLGDKAVINGDVIAPLSSLALAEKAVISGDVVAMPANINIQGPRLPRFSFYPWINIPQWIDLGMLHRIPGDIVSALLLAGLAAFVVLLFPRASERISRTIISNPFAAGGMGCLTFIVIIFMAVLLGFTLILLPVSFLGILALVFASSYGWFILGLEIGKRLETLFKVNWTPPVSAGLGVLILTLVLMAVNNWVGLCCLGGPVQVILASIGLGGVVLTIFGGGKQQPPAYQTVLPVSPAMPMPPVPTAAPMVDIPLQSKPAEGTAPSMEELIPSDESMEKQEPLVVQDGYVGSPLIGTESHADIPVEPGPQVIELPALPELSSEQPDIQPKSEESVIVEPVSGFTEISPVVEQSPEEAASKKRRRTSKKIE